MLFFRSNIPSPHIRQSIQQHLYLIQLVRIHSPVHHAVSHVEKWFHQMSGEFELNLTQLSDHVSQILHGHISLILTDWVDFLNLFFQLSDVFVRSGQFSQCITSGWLSLNGYGNGLLIPGINWGRTSKVFVKGQCIRIYLKTHRDFLFEVLGFRWSLRKCRF